MKNMLLVNSREIALTVST